MIRFKASWRIKIVWIAIFSLAKSRMKNGLTSHVYAVRFNLSKKSFNYFARLTANVSYLPQATKNFQGERSTSGRNLPPPLSGSSIFVNNRSVAHSRLCNDVYLEIRDYMFVYFFVISLWRLSDWERNNQITWFSYMFLPSINELFVDAEWKRL